MSYRVVRMLDEVLEEGSPGACEQCIYWRMSALVNGRGQCRRSPPSHDGWPTTESYDWCGEGVGVWKDEEAEPAPEPVDTVGIDVFRNAKPPKSHTAPVRS